MSARKPSSAWLIIYVAMLLTGLALWLTPQGVLAQCGSSQSSCLKCHAQVDSVFAEGEWHIIHARKDCCLNCHGGNSQTMDQDQAHLGLMLNPLDDVYLSCHQCHPDDYQQRAVQFAVILKVTPHSSEPVTHTAVLQPPSSEQLSGSPNSAPPSSEADLTPWLWPVLGMAGALLAGLAVMRYKLSHR